MAQAQERAPRNAAKAPAESALSKALQSKPIGKNSNVADLTKAIASGQRAKGSAVAEQVFKSVQSEGVTWKRHFADIMDLDNPGREQFRKELNEKIRAAREFDKAHDTKLSRTAMVRVSECMAISRAADLGMKPGDVIEVMKAKGIEGKTLENVTHAAFVESARFYRDLQATTGPTVRRGRKPLSPVDQARKWVLNNIPARMLKDVAAAILELSNVVKSDKHAAKIAATIVPKQEPKPDAGPAVKAGDPYVPAKTAAKRAATHTAALAAPVAAVA